MRLSIGFLGIEIALGFGFEGLFGFVGLVLWNS